MIWKSKRPSISKPRDARRVVRAAVTDIKRRSIMPQRLERRELFAADPIHVGVVYLETDYLESDNDVGSDSRGDRFLLSFRGGAPETELNELRIRTDKDGDGISVGDPIFDTAEGGRGKSGFHDFQVVRIQTLDGRVATAQATVADGGQELILNLENFRAGDRLEFTLDVDEVLRNSLDLAIFNDRLDVITSGQEFQDSILEAVFEAPHFESTQADAIFLNDYGSPMVDYGIDLPPDEGPGVDSRPNRSAAAIASTIQTPEPIAITGHVWLDSNTDAIRQAAEDGLAGVELALWTADDDGNYSDTGHRAATDAAGKYQFPKSLGLMPGTYRVVETQPTGLFSVAAVPGSVEGTPTGLASSLDVLSAIEIPLGDTTAVEMNFAEAAPAAIGGFVYEDRDNNGIREAGETGIAGVTVRLVPVDTVADQQSLSAITQADGSYRFDGLSPGEYRVIEVNQPAEWNDGLDTAGTVNGVTIGVASNPGDEIRDVLLGSGDVGVEYNFGELPLGELSGYVFLVAPGEDCTGVFHSDEDTPLADVIVELQTPDGNVISRTTTTPLGSYHFDDVPLGEYRIVQFTPDGLLDGQSHAGTIDGRSVGQAIDGTAIRRIVMTPGGIGVEYNFCEIAPATLSGTVYHDQSNDGVMDESETGLANVRLELIDVTGNVVAETLTDAEGRYEFVGIAPGIYSIKEYQPSGYLDGLDSVGTVDGQVSGTLGNDLISEIQIAQGLEGVEYNFGELLPASLSGSVHVDVDGDCIQDPDEVGLAGVWIRLLNASGEEVDRIQTNEDGTYRFTDLEPGRYTVVQDQPEGYFDGGVMPGSSGGIAGENQISEVDLTSGTDAVDYRFCEEPPTSISGFVHIDDDGDCIRDPDELGIEGVTIELRDATGMRVATTLTDADGAYRFDGLEAGRYTIHEIQPDGFFQGGQTLGSAGGSIDGDDLLSLTTTPGLDATDYNFCETTPASISGFVHVDDDGDCIRDPDEQGIANVTIELRDSAGSLVATTLTDANGGYRFEGLEAGRYTIHEIQPSGFFQGGQTLGSAGGSIEGIDLLALTTTPGLDATDYNFCETTPASISGFVHVDDDGDCIRDPDERGVEGVLIELRDGSGSAIATTRTASDGSYRFDGLEAGDYSVFEYQPEGLFQGGEVLGSAGGTVLGVDLLAVTLTPGQDAVDYLFCEYEPASIGGSVWTDSNENEVRDGDDAPIGGVVVKLLNADGNVIATTSTNNEGQYSFSNLERGVYGVMEQQPSQFFDGGELLGDSGGVVAGDDLMVGIELSSGDQANAYDFFEIAPAGLSGYVFIDGAPIISNSAIEPEDLRNFRDGQLTSDDTMLEGVQIELRDADGNPLAADAFLSGDAQTGSVVFTSADGLFQFEGLRPGRYTLFQTQPEGKTDSLDTAGTAGGLAINAADALGEADQQLVNAILQRAGWEADFRDAILMIDLNAGELATDYLFSEITIEDGTSDFLRPRVVDPIKPLPGPPEDFSPRKLLYSALEPELRRPTELPTDVEIVTWHLSIINGGYPRGTIATAETFKRVAMRQMKGEWDEGKNDTGQWRLMTIDGEVLEESRLMNLGGKDAIALVGDFDGDGDDEAAIYVAGRWFVDLNGNGRWDDGDLWILLGTDLDRPVVGDWDGDGKDDIGIYGRQWERDRLRVKVDQGLPDRNNPIRRLAHSNDQARLASMRLRRSGPERLLRRGDQGDLRADAVDHVFQFGNEADTPIAGDWDGDGIDQIGIYRNGTWIIDNEGDGRRKENETTFEFGEAGDRPIVGDFDGDGIDDIAVIRGNQWIIDSDGDRRLTGADQRIEIPEGQAEGQPIAGDWDGDGKDEPGYYRQAG